MGENNYRTIESATKIRKAISFLATFKISNNLVCSKVAVYNGIQSGARSHSHIGFDRIKLIVT